MRWELFIANRTANFSRGSFSGRIIRIAIAAVALSVAIMIVATALIAGFKQQISSKIFGFWGHIHIMDTNINNSYEAVPIDIHQPFYPYLDTVRNVPYEYINSFMGFELGPPVKTVTKGGIRHIQAFATKPGIIKAKDEIEGILLKGVGRDFDWSFLKNYLVEGDLLNLDDSLPSRDLVISQQTATRLKVKTGDKFVVYFVKGDDQVKRVFRVSGIYKTGLEEYDKKMAIADIREVRELLGWDSTQVAGFECFVDDLNDLDAIENYIYLEKIPQHLYAETIRQKFSSIFEWLDLSDINGIVIKALMTIVAIINMITALLILILERTNMIGVLKALGSRDWPIRKIFLYHAAVIILNGLFWGNIIGIGLCLGQQKFKWIKLSEAEYYLAFAPIELNLWTVILLNLLTLLITLACMILPSYLVTRVRPVKAIRFK